jgi:hypothetical protein
MSCCYPCWNPDNKAVGKSKKKLDQEELNEKLLIEAKMFTKWKESISGLKQNNFPSE